MIGPDRNWMPEICGSGHWEAHQWKNDCKWWEMESIKRKWDKYREDEDEDEDEQDEEHPTAGLMKELCAAVYCVMGHGRF